MIDLELIIDVPKDRVTEITPWFLAQNWDEEFMVEQSGWLPFERFYRIQFGSQFRQEAMLFKLALGGK